MKTWRFMVSHQNSGAYCHLHTLQKAHTWLPKKYTHGHTATFYPDFALDIPYKLCLVCQQVLNREASHNMSQS